MITIITGAAVAFFQATRIERLVTRNYSDLARARMAAQAAAEDGRSLIVGLFSNYPDSATAWIRPSSPGTELCAFFFRTTDAQGFLTNGANAALPASQPVFLYAFPLASGANATATANLGSSANLFTNTNTTGGQAGLSTTNSIDLNLDGWIGTNQPQNLRPTLRAKWVEILQDPSRPKNTNLTAAGRPSNPAIARYAFWMEDESFKVNVNWSGATPRADTSLGTNPAEIALQGIFLANQDLLATGIVNLKLGLQTNIPSVNSIGLISGLAPAQLNTLHQNFKFFLSAHSSSLNFSRGGFQRVNLNQVVSSVPATATNPSYSELVRTQLNRIIATITNSNAMPRFGQRFYRSGASRSTTGNLNSTSDVTAEHELIYLNKLAANIRDYIDSDSLPTVVSNNAPNYSVISVPNPTRAFDFDVPGADAQDNPVAAIGQEAVPMLTEYALRVTLVNMTPPQYPTNSTNPPSASYTLNINHYFEFWNPYQKNISAATLPNNPYLRLYNQFGWDAGGGTNDIPPGRPRPIPLSDFTNNAGQPFVMVPGGLVVLTTDPNPPANLFGGTLPTNLVSCNSPETLTGITTSTNSGGWYQLVPQVGNSAGRAGSSVSDYDTHLVIGSADGHLSSFSALPMPYDLTVTDETNSSTRVVAPSIATTNFFFRGGSLRGNGSGTAGSGSQTGDPRSLNEQLRIRRYQLGNDAYEFGADEDQTRFYDIGLNNGSNNVPARNSLGSLGTTAATNQFVDPSGGVALQRTTWPDWGGTGFGDNQPFAYLRDGPMLTIGELGHIYDPVRLPNPNAANPVVFSRGGARTLRIGQADGANPTDNALIRGLWDTNQTSASRNWTSWRLADVFCVNPPDRNGNNQIDADELTRIDGQVNINGVMRDGGRALRTLVYNLRFQASPDPGASTTSGKVANTNQLISAITNRLSSDPANIFWERGEISELGLFSSDGSQLTTPVQSMQATLDRGREELVRRLMDLICTKGNTYTVYVIGQALDPLTGRPLASQRMRRTFRINPLFGQPNDPPLTLVAPLPPDATFNPTNTPGSNGDRFRRPVRWSVDVLAESWN